MHITIRNSAMETVKVIPFPEIKDKDVDKIQILLNQIPIFTGSNYKHPGGINPDDILSRLDYQ